MAYTQFDASKPDGATQAGSAFSTSANANDKALKDGILSGRIPGYTLSVVNGSGSASANALFAKAVLREKLEG